jgi:hypothetical protein
MDPFPDGFAAPEATYDTEDDLSWRFLPEEDPIARHRHVDEPQTRRLRWLLMLAPAQE